jgi:hypothetical protein
MYNPEVLFVFWVKFHTYTISNIGHCGLYTLKLIFGFQNGLKSLSIKKNWPNQKQMIYKFEEFNSNPTPGERTQNI